jgi:hypothetical protein
MSGPKTADYSVLQNPAIEAAARAQAWASAQEVEARLDGLLNRARETAGRLGFPAITVDRLPSRPASGVRSSEIDAFTAAMRALLSRVEAQLERAILTRQTATMLATVAAGVNAQMTSATEALAGRMINRASSSPSATVDAEAPSAETRHVRVARALERLEAIVSPTERDAIQGLAIQVIESVDRMRFDNLTVELQYRIQRANDAAQAVLAGKEQAVQLQVSLRGLSGSDVDALSQELRRVEAGEIKLSTHIEQRVQAVALAARKRADRGYAGQIIREEFERIGYQVEQGFQTIFARGGTIHLRKPDMKEYAARMRVDEGEGKLDFQVVRSGGTGDTATQERLLRDRETEEAWCADLAHVMAALDRRNVRSRIAHRVAAGAERVLVVDDAAEAASQLRHDDETPASRHAQGPAETAGESQG